MPLGHAVLEAFTPQSLDSKQWNIFQSLRCTETAPLVKDIGAQDNPRFKGKNTANSSGFCKALFRHAEDGVETNTSFGGNADGIRSSNEKLIDWKKDNYRTKQRSLLLRSFLNAFDPTSADGVGAMQLWVTPSNLRERGDHFLYPRDIKTNGDTVLHLINISVSIFCNI